MTPIHSGFMLVFLSRVESQEHHIYSMMRALPREHFFIFRFNNYQTGVDGYDDPEPNTFTLAEFLERVDTIHPTEDLALYFSVRLDRLGNTRRGLHAGLFGISSCEQVGIGLLKWLFNGFLEHYCEQCLRTNTPFELTADTISRLDLTPRDVRYLAPAVEQHNAAARERIRAEYDLLNTVD